MKPPLETIRVSQRSREILVTVKRRTGIERWNVLCRWALCESLANPSRPVAAVGSQESNVEMSWDVFAGELSEVLLAMLAFRMRKDGIPSGRSEMAAYFKNHLERGVSHLQNAKDLPDLFVRANTSKER